jgi:L-ascorbate 6-phosphate lactonase
MPDLFRPPPTGRAVTLWWLGQSGFVLAGAEGRVAVDPFLTPLEGRAIPPPCRPEDLRGLDAILVTHEHVDHMDLPTLVAATAGGAGPVVVLPSPVADQAAAAGVPEARLRPVQPGEEVRLGAGGAVAVHPLAARHGLHAPPARYDFGREESGGLVRYLGYAVAIGGMVLFHSGDALVYDGLAARLRELGAEVGLLPINGRDHYREAKDIVGNMDEREAADLAAEAGMRILVPMHYDMFPHNPGDPGRLVDYVRRWHPEVAVVVPPVMRGLTLSPVLFPAPPA